jgi:hypothetical protein
MKDLDKYVEKALADISVLPEEKMRLAALGSRLRFLGPFGAARFIDAVYKRQKAVPAARVLALLVNPEGLRLELGAEGYRAVYLAAIELGLTRVSRLFTDLPPHREGPAGYAREEEAKMEMLTLGERRSLSKSFRKDTLDRLLADPDPMVVANLLDNPKVTEKEVVKVASRRPNSPEILRLIAGHRVWSKRQGVRRAVAMNPYAPPRTSVALLELMLIQDIIRVAEDKSLHPQVRAHARELIDEKKGG